MVWLDGSASHVIGAVRFPSASGTLDAGKLGAMSKAGGFQQVRLPNELTAADYAAMAF